MKGVVNLEKTEYNMCVKYVQMYEDEYYYIGG